MSAYRPTPQVPGLPLPRRGLALYEAFVAAAMVLVAIAPLALMPTFDRASGYGARGSFTTSTVVAFVTALLGLLAGRHAVRGGRRAQVVVALLPIWAVWVGVFLPLWRQGPTVERPASVEELGQLLATGDVLTAHGCLTAALACGLGVVALLGAGASVDPRDHGTRSTASGKTVVLGLGALLAAVLASFVTAAGFLPLLLIVPSLVLVTALAGISAANAPVVRTWEEPGETDAWVQAVLAAAVLAALGFFLLERASALASEAKAVRLLTKAGALTTHETPARVSMLRAVLDEGRAHDRIAAVLAAGALVVILPAGLAGRRDDGDGRRWPRGKVLGAALAAALVILVTVSRGRVALLHEVDRRASGVSDDVAARDGLELPRVDPHAPSLRSPAESQPFHIRARVDAEGNAKVERVRPSPFADPPDPYAATRIVLYADRRARWEHVSRAIEQTIPLMWEDEPGHYLPALEIRALPEAAVDRAPAGALAPLLGPDAVSFVVTLERTVRDERDERVVTPADDEPFEVTTKTLLARAKTRPGWVELILPARSAHH